MLLLPPLLVARLLLLPFMLLLLPLLLLLLLLLEGAGTERAEPPRLGRFGARRWDTTGAWILGSDR